jgi:glycosyltransferase involved in cell wall biosynthesis
MKILLISTQVFPVYPTDYGGLEAVVGDLSIGLTKLGHEVTVVTTKHNTLPKEVNVIECCEPSPSNPEKEAYEIYKPKLKEFDIIHDHSWMKFTYLHKIHEDENLKLISTIHAPNPYRTPPPVKYPCFCGVSNNHSLYLSGQLGVPVRTCYNGLQVEKFNLASAEKGNRYLHLNRIQRIKGAMQFVDLMLKTRSYGDVAGDDSALAGHSLEEQNYIETVRDRCDGAFVRYWGRISQERKIELLRKCKALICLPIPPYREVFGLSAVETLAFGKPVIVLNAEGSGCGLTEIVEHGKTGFICSNLEEVEKIIREDAVSSIKPEDCRRRAEQFDYMVMAKTHESLYKAVIEGQEW